VAGLISALRADSSSIEEEQGPASPHNTMTNEVEYIPPKKRVY
jgi:hypothetical protein